MLNFNLEIEKKGSGDAKKEVVPVSVHNQAEEITLRMWVDSLLVMDEWPDFIKDLSTKKEDQAESLASWSPGQWAVYYTEVARFVSCYCNLELHEVLELPLGLDPDEILKVKGQQFYDSIGPSLMAVYHRILDGLTEYEPKERSEFTWKGKKYEVETSEPYAFDDNSPGGKIKTIQAIQALQSEHVYKGTDENGEPILPDARYHTDLAVLAAFSTEVRPNGDRLEMPVGLMESEQWMRAKIKRFESITMDIAEDVFFFILTSKKLSLSTQASNTLSIWALLQSKILNGA